MTAAPSFFGETCRLLCDSPESSRDHWRIAPPCRRFCDTSMFTVTFTACSSPDNSSCHVWDYSACAWMRYLPSLRCLSHSLNATRNAFSDSFNSPDPVNLDPPIHNVGFCPFCFTSHFHCTRSSLRSIAVTSSTSPWFNPGGVESPRRYCDRPIRTLSELIGFSACMTHSSQCCSCPYLCLASDHWNSEL